MEIYRVWGYLSKADFKIEFQKYEAVEKPKTFWIEKGRRQKKKTDLKRIQTIYRNSINGAGGFISFHTWCLAGDLEASKKEIAKRCAAEAKQTLENCKAVIASIPLLEIKEITDRW